MHDGSQIIGNAKIVDLVYIFHIKVIGHTGVNVRQVDGDVVVSVSSGLFVPEPESVAHLMHDDVELTKQPQ